MSTKAQASARYQPRYPWAAASCAGVVEILITFPLEYLKTHTQLMASTTKISPRECFAETMKSKGFIGLYKGLSPWLYFAVPRCVVRFGVFEEATTHLLRHQNEQAAIAGKEVPSSGQLSPARGFVAGMMAGMIEGIFVVTPMHAIQTKMIHDSQSASPQLHGFWQALRVIYQRDGLLKGFWCGCISTTLKGTLTHAIRFGTFEQCRGLILAGRTLARKKEEAAEQQQQQQQQQRRLEVWESMACGGLSGLLSVAVSHPIDTVKSNMQSLGGASRYSSNLNCAQQLVEQGGARALFKGMGVRSVRVTLEIALLFTLYDQFGHAIDSVTEPRK